MTVLHVNVMLAAHVDDVPGDIEGVGSEVSRVTVVGADVDVQPPEVVLTVYCVPDADPELTVITCAVDPLFVGSFADGETFQTLLPSNTNGPDAPDILVGVALVFPISVLALLAFAALDG